jgi:hypothetical protein
MRVVVNRALLEGVLLLSLVLAQPLSGQTARPNASTSGSNALDSEQRPAEQPLIQQDTQAQQRQGQEKNRPPEQPQEPRPTYGQQTKRMMGILPNLRAVSVGEHVPPMTFREKFGLATVDNFDYSAFTFVVLEALIPMAQAKYPQFGDGMGAFGQYYWHSFADRTIGNYLTIAILPGLTSEDPRYYTLGKGRWYKRALYAYTRVLITPNDKGRNTFNFSEVAGKGAAAGLGNLYYPGGASWSNTAERWGWRVGAYDAGYNVLREFWPDINRRLLHRHQPPPPAER